MWQGDRNNTHGFVLPTKSDLDTQKKKKKRITATYSSDMFLAWAVSQSNRKWRSRKWQCDSLMLHFLLFFCNNMSNRVLCGWPVWGLLFFFFLLWKIRVSKVSHSTHTQFPPGFHLHRFMDAAEVTKWHLFLWLGAPLYVDTCSSEWISAFECVCGVSVWPNGVMQQSVTRGRGKLDWRC